MRHVHACATKRGSLVEIGLNEGHFIGDQSTFSCVTRLLCEGCYSKDAMRHVHACATKRGILFEIGL
jgi:hypothetical protein